MKRILELIRDLALAMSLLVGLGDLVWAQSAPRKYMSAATNNATLVRAGRIVVTSISASNSTATAYYLKLYNKATAPTCGTDIPTMTVLVPPIATGGHVSPNLSLGVMFPTGLGFCLVANIADADNTSAATGVAINLGAAGN